MKRNYNQLFLRHFHQHRQMIFVMGPRQAGKTTVAQEMIPAWSQGSYFSWDNVNDRELILKGSREIATKLALPALADRPSMVVFDELHKYIDWRDFLKGFYDTYPDQTRILVTGSAKLDIFSRGGDSLMGRYFPFRFHPLTVSEIARDCFSEELDLWPTPVRVEEEVFQALWRFGGYPDPLIKQSDQFLRRWHKLRSQQLFNDDMRTLTRIQDIGRMEILAEHLRRHIGGTLSYTSIARKLRTSDKTVREWLDVLRSLYYCFAIRPWSKNVVRSLLKEPKYYLWDWSLCQDEGARAENFIALHLLKAVHLWQDLGLGEYSLHFIRDKDKREVDFLVVKNGKPWLLIEVKLSNNTPLSSSLLHFQKQVQATHALQVVINMPYVDKSCFDAKGPIIVPAITFLSQLV